MVYVPESPWKKDIHQLIYEPKESRDRKDFDFLDFPKGNWVPKLFFKEELECQEFKINPSFDQIFISLNLSAPPSKTRT
jgi:hypothetical protein